MKTVLILAAGEGTRLRPYTEVLPKALFPVGKKPCIRWIYDDLRDQGAEDIIVCINEKDESLFMHEFRDEDVTFGMSSAPLGTSGEILNATQYLTVEWPILVIYADDLTYTNYKSMFHTHKTAVSNGCIGTLGLTSNNKLEVGLIRADNGHIKEFYEKPEVGRFGWASWTGRAILERDIQQHLSVGADLANHVFPKIIDKLYTYKTDSEWLDIGNIVHYQRANQLAKQGNLW